MKIVMVVVDMFTKIGHFIPLSHLYSAIVTTEAFQHEEGKLHGVPHTIVNDRDSTFLNQFWREYMQLAGVALYYSRTHHLQTDG